MSSYYVESLSGQRLQRCYEIASPRVQRYLEAEIEHVQGRLRPNDVVLELGCGYGRVALRLIGVGRRVVGIDLSEESLALANGILEPGMRCEFLCMDAVELAFADGVFDVVVCVQNGICAFRVDQEAMVRAAF